jgi:hypothetical protein
MSVTFQKCHAYNKIFILDLNKLVFYPPFIILLPAGFFSLRQVLGGCRIEHFTEMLIIHSFDRLFFEGFESFAKIKLSSPNDSLGHSEVYDPHQRFFMFAFLFILPTK